MTEVAGDDEVSPTPDNLDFYGVEGVTTSSNGNGQNDQWSSGKNELKGGVLEDIVIKIQVIYIMLLLKL